MLFTGRGAVVVDLTTGASINFAASSSGLAIVAEQQMNCGSLS